MATLRNILHEALELPAASRVDLVEKLNESIAADIAPAIHKAHLNEVRRRRQQTAAGNAPLIAGTTVLKHGREHLRQ